MGKKEGKPNRKRPETLDFVGGLLKAADKIDKTLPNQGEFHPRVTLHGERNIANSTLKQRQKLGMYQGRVVLVAFAAELALKFVWERENPCKPACGIHDLQKLFNCLSDDLKNKIRSEYVKRAGSPKEEEWKTADQVFTTCKDAFEDWRYIVEEGQLPTKYEMRVTYLKHATLSVVHTGTAVEE